MNAAWVVWTIVGGGDTQTLLAGKKKFWTLSTLKQWGHKNFVIFPSLRALVLAPHYEPPGETFAT